MVEHWRGLWGQEELPFYLVEIAPYEYEKETKPRTFVKSNTKLPG